jgi:hypothetical protein
MWSARRRGLGRWSNVGQRPPCRLGTIDPCGFVGVSGLRLNDESTVRLCSRGRRNRKPAPHRGLSTNRDRQRVCLAGPTVWRTVAHGGQAPRVPRNVRSCAELAVAEATRAAQIARLLGVSPTAVYGTGRGAYRIGCAVCTSRVQPVASRSPALPTFCPHLVEIGVIEEHERSPTIRVVAGKWPTYTIAASRPIAFRRQCSISHPRRALAIVLVVLHAREPRRPRRLASSARCFRS